MQWFLLVIFIAAAAAGFSKCSPETESRRQQTIEAPKRVERDVLRHLQEGMERNQRALEEQDKAQSSQ